MKKFNKLVTIDGPAAAGKSTIAKRIAIRLGGYHVNSGDLYRAITWLVMTNNLDPAGKSDAILEVVIKNNLEFQKAAISGDTKVILFVNGIPVKNEIIRSPEVSKNVSSIAKIPSVRAQAVNIQRKVKSLGLIVMDGRDIGTIIFPYAKFKFFLTASPIERARRRLNQADEIFNQATLESVADEISKRDEMDMNRVVAPLKPAKDAHIIDSTNLEIEQVVDLILRSIRGA